MATAPSDARFPSAAFQTFFFQSAPREDVFRASLSVSFGSANADRSERSPFPLNSPGSRRAQDGTYALEVGQMSDVVDSDSGLHIILRTA